MGLNGPLPDFVCAVPAGKCPNRDMRATCHGTLDQRCAANWASTDPEDTEPYEEYLANLERRNEQ